MMVVKIGLRRALLGSRSEVGLRFLSSSSGNLETGKRLRKKDFEYCVDLVQNRDRESYLCGLLMPHASRRSYFAVRALNVELASIKDGRKSPGGARGTGVDSDDSSTGNASIALTFRAQWWRDAIGQIYGDEIHSVRKGNTFDDGVLTSMATSCWNNPVVRVLDYAVHESNLTRRFLERLLEAREEDLVIRQLDTMDEAVTYAESIFSSLLYLSLETTNTRDDSSDMVAYHAGIGIGLVTSLRSARIRLARGECSIPKELIPSGFSNHKLYTQDPNIELSSEEKEQIRLAVKEMAMLASSHLLEARDHQSGVPKHARPCLLPVVPALQFLSKLEGVNYDIFHDSLLEPNQLKVLLLLGRTWATGVF